MLKWNDEHTRLCKTMSKNWLSLRPIEGNPKGLMMISIDIIQKFTDCGFSIETITNPEASYRPIIIARKEVVGAKNTVGFFGHYDVEPVVNIEQWSSDPWELVEKDNRWFGRGLADNLVPLAQRLILFDQITSLPLNIIYVLQGEEEIGSPFALEMYPKINLPKIDLWIEETGYYYKDGRQRIMLFNRNSIIEKILKGIIEMNIADERGYTIRERPLNKAFGAEQCPCLLHLVGDTPYLAIGPNDDFSTIHGANESISPKLLPVCTSQYELILKELST
jgi:acetylornithine deacetylase/succinyl-diaminopimelate desuccinylase-like protein